MLKHWNADKKRHWDNHVTKNPDGGLLQSWAWGEFQEDLGNAVYNVSNEDETVFAQCLQLKAGSQWILSIPRGPVTEGGGEEALAKFFSELKAFAKERGCFLVRFDPVWRVIPLLSKEGVGEVKSHKELQPVHTLILDTTPSEEALLKNMKSKWRYNIRLAQKKGVRTRWSNDPKDAEIFARLMEKTTNRQEFASYDKDYFQLLMKHLGPADHASFVFAQKDGEPIAALLIGFSGDVASYLHGASDHAHRHLMAPHLLQWEAIKEAKRRGMRYDFWGVATDPPSNKQEEQWKGVTRFKKGFAPNRQTTEYGGTYEIPVKKGLYYMYRLRSKAR